MERCGRAGVFLGTLDEVSDAIAKPKRRITLRIVESDTKVLYLDLKILDDRLNTLFRGNDQVRLTGTSKEEQEKATHEILINGVRYNMVYFMPNVVGGGDSHTQARLYSMAERAFGVSIGNGNVILLLKKPEYQQYFTAPIAYGRIYEQNKKSSYEIMIFDSFTVNDDFYSDLTLSDNFMIRVRFLVDVIFLFMGSNVFLESCTLSSLRRFENAIRIDSTATMLKMIAKKETYASHISLSISLSNALFNNVFIMKALKVSRIQEVNFKFIREKMSTLTGFHFIVPHSDFLDGFGNLRSNTEFNKKIIEIIPVESERTSFYDEIFKVDWNALYRIFSRSEQLKAFMQSVIDSYNSEINSVRKDSSTPDGEFIPIKYKESCMYTNTEKTHRLYFKYDRDTRRVLYYTFGREANARIDQTSNFLSEKKGYEMFDESGQAFKTSVRRTITQGQSSQYSEIIEIPVLFKFNLRPNTMSVVDKNLAVLEEFSFENYKQIKYPSREPSTVNVSSNKIYSNNHQITNEDEYRSIVNSVNTANAIENPELYTTEVNAYGQAQATTPATAPVIIQHPPRVVQYTTPAPTTVPAIIHLPRPANGMPSQAPIQHHNQQGIQFVTLNDEPTVPIQIFLNQRMYAVTTKMVDSSGVLQNFLFYEPTGEIIHINPSMYYEICRHDNRLVHAVTRRPLSVTISNGIMTIFVLDVLMNGTMGYVPLQTTPLH